MGGGEGEAGVGGDADGVRVVGDWYGGRCGEDGVGSDGEVVVDAVAAVVAALVDVAVVAVPDLDPVEMSVVAVVVGGWPWSVVDAGGGGDALGDWRGYCGYHGYRDCCFGFAGACLAVRHLGARPCSPGLPGCVFWHVPSASSASFADSGTKP